MFIAFTKFDVKRWNVIIYLVGKSVQMLSFNRLYSLGWSLEKLYTLKFFFNRG